MTDQADWEGHAMDVALARYAVIAPLVSRSMGEEERRRLLQEVASAVHCFPGGKQKRVSLRSVRRWTRWFLEGHRNEKNEVVSAPGVDALKPLVRADRGVPRKADSALLERAERLRREEPVRTTGTLIDILKSEAAAREQEPPDISEATLAFHLRARGASRRDLKREGRAFRRYQHAQRNAVWQGDWSQGLPLPDPRDPKRTRMSHLHLFIDDCTRYVPHGEFYFRQNLPCLEDCFRKAVLKGGVPSCTYWDNGAVYQARQVSLIAARLGIQVIFATPYAPEGKGKVERVFRTIKEQFYPEARRAGLTTLPELNEFFWGWLEGTYHDRIHSELDATPRERWVAGEAGVRTLAAGDLVDTFLWEEERKVDKSGCVQLGSNVYAAGEHLVGRTVTVRFDPFDLARVRLYLGGRFIEVLEPHKLESRTYRKALPRRIEKAGPLESSRAFKEQVSKGYRREVESVLEQTRSAGVPTEACLTRVELAALLVGGLGGRHLTVAEAAQVADFFHKHAPLRGDLVREALGRAIEEKGPNRHLRFYLDAVRRVRLEGGERR